ncbi:MAG TPA: universal stress protein [Gammaproteobacteria bacterium]|nr:universal stress protein [Gammaproteobacteria bacterium]
MFNNVLIAVHPTNDEEGKRALQEGVRLLADSGSLHLVSVFNPSGTSFFPHVIDEEPQAKEQEIRNKLDLLARKYLPLNLTANLHVLSGAPGEQLIALAAQLNTDLVILTSRGAGSRWSLRRATVEHVTVCAPCAVLVLHAGDDCPAD